MRRLGLPFLLCLALVPRSAAAQEGHLPPQLFRGPIELTQANATGELPAGSVRVQVSDAEGEPLAQATIELASMRAEDNARQVIRGRSDDKGVYVFSGVATGSAQAYRVRVPHQGAVYASAPFQLPVDQGFEVRVTRLETTRNPRFVVMLVGHSEIEFNDDRLHVIQAVRLLNLGEHTYVFPKEGEHFALPKGYKAFQSQPVMSDQKLEPARGGFRLKGSLPPGQTLLTWSFDLPYRGSKVDLSFGVPYKFFMQRVVMNRLADARLKVDKFPAAKLIHDGGRSAWMSELQRHPQDPAIPQISLHIDRLPGPGPWRWVAVAAASLCLLLGAGFAARRKFRHEAAAARKAEASAPLPSPSLSSIDPAMLTHLRAQLDDIESRHAAGEIGPQSRERMRRELIDAVALRLREEQASAASAVPGQSSR